MDGVIADWKRIEGGERVQLMINEITKKFNFEQPELSVAALVTLYKTVKGLPESNWRNKKLDEVQQIIEACTGLFTEAVTQQEYAVQGDSLKINFNFNNRSNVPVALNRLTLISAESVMQKKLAGVKPDETANVFIFSSNKQQNLLDTSVKINLAKNLNVSIDHSFKLDDYSSLSQPYWLEHEMKQGYFDVKNPLLIGKAENDPNYTVKYEIQ
jgi:hypothetical protein